VGGGPKGARLVGGIRIVEKAGGEKRNKEPFWGKDSLPTEKDKECITSQNAAEKKKGRKQRQKRIFSIGIIVVRRVGVGKSR